MAPTTCPLCRSRKGKRACPAKNETICSACCGEKRIVEIACPQGCVYLGQGVQHELQMQARDYLTHQDPRKAMRWVRAVERFGLFLDAIETAIASSSVPNLKDAEILVALEAAAKTFESEARGVVYEHLPESPTLQALAREITGGLRAIVRVIDEERAKLGGEGEKLPKIGPEILAECLGVMAERFAFQVEHAARAGSLVEHLRRVHPSRPPSPEAPSPGTSRIVLG